MAIGRFCNGYAPVQKWAIVASIANPQSRDCKRWADGAKEGKAMILPKDRDPRFITVRRGGTLQEADHQLLAEWAADCAEHVLHLFEAA